MAGIRRAEQFRPRYSRGLILVVAGLLTLALIAPAARATDPTQGEYQLKIPHGGDPGAPSGGTHSSPGTVGGSGSDSALPALLVGFVAIGSGGVAYAYLRRRRSGAAS